ncbi:uncharacterized protein [Nicotiana sylvestris]|uniref:uncharacterized protein n=1 Tax=Nicotiana sylvestris TaxID=4096 RepID=UPI00388CC65A
MVHRIARNISIAAEQKLIRAIKHAKAEARRETLEGIRARGTDLSADLKEDCELEEELALLVAPDEGEGAGGSFEMRPCPPGEEDRLLASGSRSVDKRKDSPGLKSELLHSEAPLRKALNREKSLKLLCAAKESELVSLQCEVDRSWSRSLEICLQGEVGRAKREFNELQAHVSAHFVAKEKAQAKVSALEMQIQTVRANDSALANMIARLSSELSKEKIDVVNVRAEVVMSNTRAGQKVVAYLKSVAAAKAELKRALIV